MNLEFKIESILFFRNEPVAIAELARILDIHKDEVSATLKNLQEFYRDRGIVLVSDGESVGFGTHRENSELIEKLQKEEFSRELGRAGLETLAIIAYRGPISRREIDQIRGVNSGFILRILLIRGLIERTEGDPSTVLKAGRSFTYKPTLKLLEYLGVTSREELPEFKNAFVKIQEFVNNHSSEQLDV
ncbi:MAG: SMC-Scp complex subunit ScpB [Candidatus Zambryskibacteria bacterium]|nr:SMC-Scp complex subunit ScpB [Candidatus Zambryskibacteria bacterium]